MEKLGKLLYAEFNQAGCMSLVPAAVGQMDVCLKWQHNLNYSCGVVGSYFPAKTA